VKQLTVSTQFKNLLKTEAVLIGKYSYELPTFSKTEHVFVENGLPSKPQEAILKQR